MIDRADFLYAQSLLAKMADGWNLKAIVAAVAAFGAWVFPTEALQSTAVMALVMLVLDTITGLMASWHNRVPIQSAKMRRLLIKITGYGVFVLVVTIVARSVVAGVEETLAAQAYALTATLGWVIATEAVSILENLAAADLPMPPQVKRWLKERVGGKLGRREGEEEEST